MLVLNETSRVKQPEYIVSNKGVQIRKKLTASNVEFLKSLGFLVRNI